MRKYANPAEFNFYPTHGIILPTRRNPTGHNNTQSINTERINYMKKIIKKSTTTCDYSTEDQKLLDKLNAIFKKTSTLHAKYSQIIKKPEFDREAATNILDNITRLSRQFNDLVACLPQIKFNNSTGNYMFKYDEDGNERFCVRIDVSRTFEVTVSAKDWQSAKNAAADVLLDDLINPLSIDVKFADMSGSAN